MEGRQIVIITVSMQLTVIPNGCAMDSDESLIVTSIESCSSCVCSHDYRPKMQSVEKRREVRQVKNQKSKQKGVMGSFILRTLVQAIRRLPGTYFYRLKHEWI